MKRRFVYFIPALLILGAILNCSVPLISNDSPFFFPTIIALFPSLTPSTTQEPLYPLNTVVPTASPTPIPRNWPPPYFGSPGPTPVTPVPTPMTIQSNPQGVNVVLLGADSRISSSFRTDTIIVVNIQADENLITLISIPRDLYVYVPGWTMNRINTAFLHGDAGYYDGGGAALIKDTILYNLGIYVDHFALIDFSGFRNVIDILEGIDIPMVCPYTDWHIIDPSKSKANEDNWALKTIGPGIVHMDSDLALWYARSRQRSSDFDRGRRQQEIIRSIFNKALKLNMLTRIPQLFEEVHDTVITDFSLGELLALAPVAAKIRSVDIRSYFINNELVDGWRTPTGGSVLLPDGQLIERMLVEALNPPGESEQINTSIIVEIWNGTNNNNWDILAAERLNYAGYNFHIGIADHRNYTNSFLINFSEELETNSISNLLSIFNIPFSRLEHISNPDSPFQYRIIIGSDFNPCFNPAQVIR
jgi:LCP family protein required for cell wall assembly